MQTTEQPKKVWKVNGRGLSRVYKPGDLTSNPKNDINVKETCRSVDMDPPQTGRSAQNPRPAYGLPITAKLGVALIADLQSRLLPILAAFNDMKAGVHSMALSDEDLEWLRELLIRSSAITIDKNVVLKTLSQPGCEGVRFYLCRKVVKNAGSRDKTPYMSLVTVGVDAKGNDLHYVYKKGKLIKGLQKADLEDISLLSEYGSPPPPSSLSGKSSDPYDEKFAILQYAMEEADNIIRSQKP